MRVDGAAIHDFTTERHTPLATPQTVQVRRLALGLAALQAFVALGAIPAGVALVTDPTGSSLGLPIEILTRSPFDDFYVPGLFLLGINGLGSLLGVVLSLLRARWAGEVATALGLFLMLWMVVQMMWTLVLGPLQFALLWVGIIEAGLGMALRDLRRH